VFVGIYWQRYGWVAPEMEISGLEDEYRLAAGKPMLLYLKRPAPDQEPRLAAMIDTIPAAGTVSYRTFATPRELERLLADDLAVLLSESFAGAAVAAGAPAASPGGTGEAELPAGDVCVHRYRGSARLWEGVPDAMAQAVALHDETRRGGFGHRGGVVFAALGDGMAAAFSSPTPAVRAAVEAQRALLASSWPDQTGALKVRMGLHTDEAVPRNGRYTGAPVTQPGHGTQSS
jgi:hypothetical protein